jgi:hypothetical protein
VPPLVLILDEGRVRPFDDAERDRIEARPDERADIEFGREVGVLAESDIRAVDDGDEDALGGPDVEHDPSTLPRVRNVDRPLVEPGGVPIRDVGWLIREWDPDVGVLGPVVETLHRPTAGNGRAAPIRPCRRLRTGEELEAPFPVEFEPVRVWDRMHRQAVQRGQLGSEPRARYHAGTPANTSQSAIEP